MELIKYKLLQAKERITKLEMTLKRTIPIIRDIIFIRQQLNNLQRKYKRLEIFMNSVALTLVDQEKRNKILEE